MARYWYGNTEKAAEMIRHELGLTRSPTPRRSIARAISSADAWDDICTTDNSLRQGQYIHSEQAKDDSKRAPIWVSDVRDQRLYKREQTQPRVPSARQARGAE
jgi:hypothetical protein